MKKEILFYLCMHDCLLMIHELLKDSHACINKIKFLSSLRHVADLRGVVGLSPNSLRPGPPDGDHLGRVFKKTWENRVVSEYAQ